MHFLSLQSLDISNTVYNSDWANLSNNARKMLVIIMARSLTPVEITSAYILPLNLESFKGVSIYIEIYDLYKRKLKTILGKQSNSPLISEKTVPPILHDFCIIDSDMTVNHPNDSVLCNRWSLLEN